MLAYRSALDGLRGYGMLGFMLGHLGVMTFMPGLWVYMNGFFVLSAFLIVRLLMAEAKETGHIDSRAFYVRRARRLLPALFVTLTAVVIDGIFFAPESERTYLKGDIFSTLLYVMNWRLLSRDDAYFEEFSHPSILRHAWSLSVEEQFYIFVPLIMLGVLLYARRRRTRTAFFVGVALLSALWTSTIDLGVLSGQAHAYYGTDVRVQALAVGAALGVWSGHRGRGSRLCRGRERDEPLERDPSRAHVLGWVGFLGLGVLFFTAQPFNSWMFPRGGLLVSCVLAAMYIVGCFQSQRTLLVRLHQWRPIVYTGKISYGLYLYHWPIFLWLRRGLTGTNTFVLAGLTLVLTFVVAHVSYRYLERPIMRHGLGAFGLAVRRGRVAFGTWLGGIVIGTVAMSAGAMANPYAGGVPQYVPNIPQLVPGQASYDKDQPLKVALFGDSVPFYLSQRLPQQNFPGLRVTNLGVPGCDMLDETVVWSASKRLKNDAQCTASKRDLAAHVRSSGARVVLMMPGLELSIPHELGNSTVWFDDPRYRELVITQLGRLHSRAQQGGARQVAVSTVPCRNVNDLDIPQENKQAFLSNTKVATQVERPDRINTIIRDWARANNVPVIDLAGPLCSTPFQSEINGRRIYDDGIHFSPAASPMMWGWLAPQLQQLATRN